MNDEKKTQHECRAYTKNSCQIETEKGYDVLFYKKQHIKIYERHPDEFSIPNAYEDVQHFHNYMNNIYSGRNYGKISFDFRLIDIMYQTDNGNIGNMNAVLLVY